MASKTQVANSTALTVSGFKSGIPHEIKNRIRINYANPRYFSV
jgi:hypothetical protein